MSEHSEDLTLSVAVPQEWVDRIEERSRQTGHPISELLREAVGQYFGFDTADPSNSQVDLEMLKREVADLQRKLFVLEKTPPALKTLEARVATLERRVGWGTATSGLSAPPVVGDADDDEEIYDEPDEILTDFLPD